MVKAQESSLAEEGPISNGQNHSSINIVATTEYTSRVSRVRIKNRRKAYLDQNPAYFENLDLELADPLLYDRCIRRFQSPAEREAEGRKKGYSGVLEADLYRSEAKVAALAQQEGLPPSSPRNVSYVRDPSGEIFPEDPDELPSTKEEGLERWKYEMTLRFVQGKDQDFSYDQVDNDEGLDVLEKLEAEDRWFEEEEPEWTEGGTLPRGETGIQDF